MRRIIYSLLATITGLVLLVSYRTSTGETLPVLDAQRADASSTSASAPGATSSGASSTGAGSAASTSAAGLVDGTYTGDPVQTRYGTVQVAITVSGGSIASVDVPAAPDANPRDAQISARAVPQLVAETLDAQSAQIDMVSGATYTSDGYSRSLQSAIDEARA